MDIEVKPSAEVPNDPIKANGGGNRQYPFNTMDIGDAFLLPPGHRGATSYPGKKSPRIAAAAAGYGSYHGVKFSCRRQRDGGVRVERIA